MVIAYMAPVSVTSVFNSCYSLDLEKAEYKKASFQYSWLESYFFNSLRESRPNIPSY